MDSDTDVPFTVNDPEYDGLYSLLPVDIV